MVTPIQRGRETINQTAAGKGTAAPNHGDAKRRRILSIAPLTDNATGAIRIGSGLSKLNAHRDRMAKKNGVLVRNSTILLVSAAAVLSVAAPFFHNHQPPETNLNVPSITQPGTMPSLGAAPPDNLWANTPLAQIAADQAFMELKFPQLVELLRDARRAGIFTTTSQFYDEQIVRDIRAYYAMSNAPEARWDRESARTNIEQNLGGAVQSALQAQGLAFYAGGVSEVYLPVMEGGSSMFSIAGGKVRVDNLGAITPQRVGDELYATQQRTFNIPLQNETSQTVTITDVRVAGIQNTMNVTLAPGEKADILLRRVPPVVGTVTNFEQQIVDVNGTRGGRAFTETFTLNIIDRMTSNGNGAIGDSSALERQGW